MLKQLLTKKVFCIGIGGIGVSGLAELLHQHGVNVCGSDTADNAQTKRLRALGITVFPEHAAKNIHDADLVVYSSAIKLDNPERQAALENNIPLITRGQLLAFVTQDYCSIIIAGTHGKTTTSGMISWIFEQAKKDPTYMVGGVLRDRNSPMRLGASKFFIAESDESDASFLLLSPTVTVITNIDLDHMETYEHDFEKLKNSFLQFVSKIPSEGFVVACLDDPVLRTVIPKISARVITYGEQNDADYCMKNFRACGLQSEWIIRTSTGEEQPIQLPLAGKHNALNATAAWIVAREYHLSMSVVQNALCTFPGMRRRFQSHGEMSVPGGHALLFDDYGHHPTEVRATLQAAKMAWPDRRIVLVFQPHRYSRTRDLLPDFIRVLKTVDQLVLTEVYAASETKIPGADSAAIFFALQAEGVASEWVQELTQLPAVLQQVVRPNDVVILQGAGNIVTMADVLTS